MDLLEVASIASRRKRARMRKLRKRRPKNRKRSMAAKKAARRGKSKRRMAARKAARTRKRSPLHAWYELVGPVLQEQETEVKSHPNRELLEAQQKIALVLAGKSPDSVANCSCLDDEAEESPVQDPHSAAAIQQGIAKVSAAMDTGPAASSFPSFAAFLGGMDLPQNSEPEDDEEEDDEDDGDEDEDDVEESVASRLVGRALAGEDPEKFVAESHPQVVYGMPPAPQFLYPHMVGQAPGVMHQPGQQGLSGKDLAMAAIAPIALGAGAMLHRAMQRGEQEMQARAGDAPAPSLLQRGLAAIGSQKAEKVVRTYARSKQYADRADELAKKEHEAKLKKLETTGSSGGSSLGAAGALAAGFGLGATYLGAKHLYNKYREKNAQQHASAQYGSGGATLHQHAMHAMNQPYTHPGQGALVLARRVESKDQSNVRFVTEALYPGK